MAAFCVFSFSFFPNRMGGAQTEGGSLRRECSEKGGKKPVLQLGGGAEEKGRLEFFKLDFSVMSVKNPVEWMDGNALTFFFRSFVAPGRQCAVSTLL